MKTTILIFVFSFRIRAIRVIRGFLFTGNERF
jgi:hypothetical protein